MLRREEFGRRHRGKRGYSLALARTDCVPFAYFIFVNVFASANTDNTYALPLQLLENAGLWEYTSDSRPVGAAKFFLGDRHWFLGFFF